MNRKELEIKIKEAGFPKNSYTLFSKPKEETLCVQYLDPRWIVFYYERGLLTNKKEFDSESEACEYFFGALSAWFLKKSG